jgi:hypothetical protein
MPVGMAKISIWNMKVFRQDTRILNQVLDFVWHIQFLKEIIYA